MSIWLSLIANPVFHNQYGLRICRRHTSVFHWQPIFGYRRLHWHWALLATLRSGSCLLIANAIRHCPLDAST